MIKKLQDKYGSEAPSMFRHHKHARVETSTTRRGFSCSLSKKLINLPLNNRTMNCQHLDIKLPEVMEQGRMGPKLKMVTPNHIKHKPVGCNASPLIKKFDKYTNLKSCRCRWWGGWRSWGLWHIRNANPHVTPFLPVSTELMETLPSADVLPLGQASFPLSKWGLLGKDAPLVPSTNPDIDLFCTVKWNPVHGLALPPLSGGKDWDKATEWACARDQLIWPYRQASLGGITSPRLWRKGNCEA